MKKSILFILFSLLISSVNHVNAQVNNKGSIVFDPYYGFPNFGAKFVQSIVDSAATNVVVKGLGPLGLRGEYFLSEKFGLGFDFIYNNYSATYPYENAGTTYENKLKAQRYRVQLRMNYHFVNEDNLDAYFGFGAGTNNRKYTETSTDPSFVPSKASAVLLPFSLRLAIGMRYYFMPGFGVNAEIGIGGPLVSTGLSFRL